MNRYVFKNSKVVNLNGLFVYVINVDFRSFFLYLLALMQLYQDNKFIYKHVSASIFYFSILSINSKVEKGV